jgi:hypothetical protein
MSKQLASSNPPTYFSSQGAFNYSQAAAYAGVKFSAIETVVREGRLPGRRRLGRNIIILKSDLDNFLASLDVVYPSAVPSPAIAFDLKQAAAEASCSVWFLRLNIKNGNLRARLAGKKFLIVAADLADFVKHLPRRRAIT